VINMNPSRVELLEAELTSAILQAFYDVYNELGYGFREHVYALALERELIARGHRVSREYRAVIYYKGRRADLGSTRHGRG
jgi:GxxExxY protein